MHLNIASAFCSFNPHKSKNMFSGLLSNSSTLARTHKIRQMFCDREVDLSMTMDMFPFLQIIMRQSFFLISAKIHSIIAMQESFDFSVTLMSAKVTLKRLPR